MLQKSEIPFVELQTNGILIQQKKKIYESHVKNWGQLGLRTISISVVHYESEINKKIYMRNGRDYIDLPELIDYLHEHDFSVRLSVVLASNLIDDISQFQTMIEFAKHNEVEQLTFRPVAKPTQTSDEAVSFWVGKNYLNEEVVSERRDQV